MIVVYRERLFFTFSKRLWKFCFFFGDEKFLYFSKNNSLYFFWNHYNFFSKKIQNTEISNEIVDYFLNELCNVFQSMIQTTSYSHFRIEESMNFKENSENIKVLIQENNNVFQRVCSVLNSIIILKENILVK